MKNKIVNKAKHTVHSLWDIIEEPAVGVLPGQIAFFLVLSIFPILLLLGLIGSLFEISVSTIISSFTKALPHDIANIITNFTAGKGFDSNVGISMITGFLLASNSAHSIILASNALYEFPNASYIRRRIKSILIIILLMILFFLTFFGLAFGDIILKSIFNLLHMTSYLDMIYRLFIFLKWPIFVLIMYFGIKLIYTVAPDKQILSQETRQGAWFTTVGWVLATFIYSSYVNNFTTYDIFYGSLSSIVIMMIWIYVLSYILVIGIAINVRNYKVNHED